MKSAIKAKSRRKYARGMVFGVFDCLHAGHRSFLRQAKAHARMLIVAVARAETVFRLKGRKPLQSERKRLAALRRVAGVSRALLGDRMPGRYGVIRKYKPDIICLGYDQRRLMEDLRKRMRLGQVPKIKLIRLKAYRPRRYHTSKLHKHKPHAP